jgi:hypothetical protein
LQKKEEREHNVVLKREGIFRNDLKEWDEGCVIGCEILLTMGLKIISFDWFLNCGY